MEDWLGFSKACQLPLTLKLAPGLCVTKGIPPTVAWVLRGLERWMKLHEVALGEVTVVHIQSCREILEITDTVVHIYLKQLSAWGRGYRPGQEVYG